VQVPELVRLERYHKCSTWFPLSRPAPSRDEPFRCFASCFPGGSITGAPKFRAMDIIESSNPLAEAHTLVRWAILVLIARAS